MKRFLTLTIISFCFLLSCKKSDTEKATSGSIQIKVAGLSATTDLNLSLACKCGRNILNVTKQYGNKTYETLSVMSGDEINVTVSSSTINDMNGNGSGDLKFIYNGNELFAISGNLMGATGRTGTFKIP